MFSIDHFHRLDLDDVVEPHGVVVLKRFHRTTTVLLRAKMSAKNFVVF